jgi:hypothetical protein
VPANTHALSRLPLGNSRTEFVDDARDFVTWNTGILNPGPRAIFGQRVTVTNTARLHLDAHLPRTRSRNLSFHNLEIRSGTGNLRGLH